MILWVVLIALAAYRLYRIIALDSISEPLRGRLLARDGRVAQWVTDLLLCPWCIGWWYCGAMSAGVGYFVGWEWWMVLLAWGASSTITGLLEQIGNPE